MPTKAELEDRIANGKNRPGYQTTEFWLAVLILVASTFLLFYDKIDANLWAIGVGINGAGYAVSRGIAKR